MGAVRGKDFKLYYNSDVPYDDVPTWVEVTNVKDVTQNVEKALADASTRGSSFRQQVGTLKDLSIDFQMVHDPSDAARTAFETAFYTDADVEILILDGPIATVNSAGIRFMSQVTKFTGNQGLEDVGLDDVTIVPSYSATDAPRRVHVASPDSVIDT
jgi:hypothetical protein